MIRGVTGPSPTLEYKWGVLLQVITFGASPETKTPIVQAPIDLTQRLANGEQINIGRRADNSIRFPAQFNPISTHHGTLAMHSDGILLYQDSSRNGTFIDAGNYRGRRTRGEPVEIADLMNDSHPADVMLGFPGRPPPEIHLLFYRMPNAPYQK